VDDPECSSFSPAVTLNKPPAGAELSRWFCPCLAEEERTHRTMPNKPPHHRARPMQLRIVAADGGDGGGDKSPPQPPFVPAADLQFFRMTVMLVVPVLPVASRTVPVNVWVSFGTGVVPPNVRHSVLKATGIAWTATRPRGGHGVGLGGPPRLWACPRCQRTVLTRGAGPQCRLFPRATASSRPPARMVDRDRSSG